MAKRTREELMKLGEIDPELAKAVAANPPNFINAGDFFAIRAARAEHLAKLRHLLPITGPIPEVAEEDTQIPVRDGSTIHVKIYRPSAPKTPGPLFVMYHEGGWSMGTHPIRQLTKHSSMISFQVTTPMKS